MNFSSKWNLEMLIFCLREENCDTRTNHILRLSSKSNSILIYSALFQSNRMNFSWGLETLLGKTWDYSSLSVIESKTFPGDKCNCITTNVAVVCYYTNTRDKLWCIQPIPLGTSWPKVLLVSLWPFRCKQGIRLFRWILHLMLWPQTAHLSSQRSLLFVYDSFIGMADSPINNFNSIYLIMYELLTNSARMCISLVNVIVNRNIFRHHDTRKIRADSLNDGSQSAWILVARKFLPIPYQYQQSWP